VLQGISDERQAAEVQRQLTALEVVPMCGTRTAVAAARNYRALRARGKTVRKTIDCLIATSCLLEGNALLHRNRDFDAFEQFLGLQVVHP